MTFYRIAPILFSLALLSGCGSDDKTITEDPQPQPSAAKLPNGEDCTTADNCKSGYCNENGKCANVPAPAPKANGAACTNASECASHYCGADNTCADKPSDPVPAQNGARCTKASDCASGYCGDDNTCADKPAQQTPFPNGADCKYPSECASGFCDAGKCATKVVAPKPNGRVCKSGTDCASGYCNSDGLCADKPQQSSDVLDIQQIPDDQNNADGASCDPATFVEHCNGNHIVYCERDAKGNATVHSDDCTDDAPVCMLTLMDGRNRSLCIDSEKDCKKGAAADTYCTTDDDGYEIRHSYECQQFADGKYYYAYMGYKYCSGKCTQKKCETIACDPANGNKCPEDGKYTLECDKAPDGSYVYKAFSCTEEGLSCIEYEGWTTCGDPSWF